MLSVFAMKLYSVVSGIWSLILLYLCSCVLNLFIKNRIVFHWSDLLGSTYDHVSIRCILWGEKHRKVKKVFPLVLKLFWKLSFESIWKLLFLWISKATLCQGLKLGHFKQVVFFKNLALHSKLKLLVNPLAPATHFGYL